MTDPQETVVLVRYPDELSALLLVGDLNSQGIPASVEGGLTAGLRTEAPGTLAVRVRQGDLELARQILNDRAPAEGWEDEAEQTPSEDDEDLDCGASDEPSTRDEP